VLFVREGATRKQYGVPATLPGGGGMNDIAAT
jgi:hypothetical protein